MEFIGWMIDIAREQSPSTEWLAAVLSRSRAAGYNAVGIYLEHRFAYPSAPWAAAPGCLTPDALRDLARRFSSGGPRIIPFLNTLGHMEGFIRSEGGQWLAEGPATGSLQMCPSRSECVEFARALVADALDAFDDEWVHLGGDETRQLGQCPLCAQRAASVGSDGLYAEYFGGLCRWVLERGRRPCLWGDMLLKHRDALDAIPRQTIIFDWQYDSRPAESTRFFRAHGFDVVCCPSVQTYNSGWCFLGASQRNIDQHAVDAAALGALGVLVTTWELSFFSSYASILPVVYAAGRRLARDAMWSRAIEAEGGFAYARVAEILGNQIPAASRFLTPGTWRQLRDRFVIRQNPFELWGAWRDEACGPVGDAVLKLCDEAQAGLDADSPLHFPIELHRAAVEWVRLVERAYRHYADRCADAAAALLERDGPALLNNLRPPLERIAAAGGSPADVDRLDRLRAKLHRVIERLRGLRAAIGDSEHLPAFETLIDDAYVPHDQAVWRGGPMRNR